MNESEDKSIYEPFAAGQSSNPTELQRMRNAKKMRKKNLEAYGKSFADHSLIDPDIAPKLSYKQRLYLRAYNKLFEMFMEDYTILAEIKEERERTGVGFLYPLPDPKNVKLTFMNQMKSIIGEAAYEGYERSLAFEQKGKRPSESDLFLGDGWEE